MDFNAAAYIEVKKIFPGTKLLIQDSDQLLEVQDYVGRDLTQASQASSKENLSWNKIFDTDSDQLLEVQMLVMI